MGSRNKLVKFGMVIGGYVVACIVASAAAYINQLLTPDAAGQASAGMSAFSDLLLFIGLFGILALFPTGLALYFLLRNFRER